jgi:hypothetical protein
LRKFLFSLLSSSHPPAALYCAVLSIGTCLSWRQPA